MGESANIFDSARSSLQSLLGGRSGWALGDQLLISFTNFFTMWLVAMGLGKDAFGTFSLVYSVLLLANILQFSLVTQPHNILGATKKGDEYRLYTAAGAFVQLLLLVVMCSLAAAAALVGFSRGWPVASQLMALVAGIAAWQLQEFCRRVLYTETRLRGAFANDVISYGGQAVVVAVLWWQGALTGALALWALAATSAVAAIVGFWQIHDAFKWQINRQAIIDNWHFGKWLLGSEMLQWLSSLQMFLYLAAYMFGVGAAGTLRAAQLLFGPARSVGYFLQTVLPTRFARTLAEEGEKGLSAQLRRALVLVLMLLGPYCLLLALFPRPILTTVFNNPSYADQPSVLVLYSIQAMLSYFAVVMTSALAARRMTRDVFQSCVFGSIAAVALSWPFLHWLKVPGAVACMMTSTTIMSTFLVLRYRACKRPAFERPSEPMLLGDKERACAS